MKPAREPASSRPKPCASLKKPHESCPFAAPCGPRRKKNDLRSEISFSLRKLPVRAFDSRAQGFSPPLARQRSSCPPPSKNLAHTHLIENYQGFRDIAPCLSRAATLPKATKLELGRGAHLKTPSSANHTAAASQPTGRIAKAASWLHLSRVNPALHPLERPSHTHTPKPSFGGRGHEMLYLWVFRYSETSTSFSSVAKLSLSNAARLSFSDLCILLFLFLSLCRLCVCAFLCSHWSLVDVPLIFFCPADHVPDWQPRVLLGMVEARSVNVKKTTTTTTVSSTYTCVFSSFLYCC